MNRKIYYQLFLLLFLSCSKAEKEVQEDLFLSNTTESTTENGSNIQNTTEDSNNGGTIAEDSTSTTPNEEIEGNGVVTKDGPLEKYLTLNKSITYQKVDGFGAGIKRRTEDLYKLSSSLREKVEKYCFQDLEVNMIRFFIYHDLEPINDNDNPLELDESKLDWTPFDSDPNKNRTRYVGEALNNAMLLSKNGFDHIIGNCNSPPGWLKSNGKHNGGGTLINGGESEYSEFLIATLKGLKTRYGINMTAISPTNEPDYEVAYESMDTTPAELSSIILNLDDRLDQEGLSDIKIVSPECFRVHQNSERSTTTYINAMFADDKVKNGVDIVATHTYADPNHNANWRLLKQAASNKPVWVTESGVNRSLDQSMSDAANYIKWIIRGFNEGGLTAYMLHLFYGEAEERGYSSLVAWTPSGEIILPKRYYSLKHFANLVKPGYFRISADLSEANIFVVAFKSPNEDKVVLQIFNQGIEQNLSIDVIPGSKSIQHIVTSDNEGENFISKNHYSPDKNYFNLNVPSMSLNSIIFNLN